MSLLTRCTNCHTVFRITPEQLQAHGGKVRCGRCLQIFDGMVALAPDAPAGDKPEMQEPEIPQPVAAAPAAAVAGPALETLPPSPASVDESVVVPPPDTVSDTTADAEPLIERLPEAPAETAASSPSLELEAERLATAAENPFIHEPEMTEPAPRRPWLAAAGIVLGLVLAGQAIFFYRGEIAARHPQARQWLNAVCAQAGCTVPLPRVTKALLIEASDLQLLDPSRPERIQLTATLRNHAGHVVAYPALDLVLTNANDHTLARRIFLPAEYLGERDPRAGIAANAELTVRLALETGSLGAAGFRLAVLPAPLR
ncbi:MAG: DUF3426 domain-containing protein [Burkholderiales bacterium]|jgi:predicted Zn finger-like uncharacterized protein|nr:DUF3426 domain-containing protein [Burkholderiales bacterium]